MDGRRIVAVNTSDLGGGAERVARLLHGGLRERGWDAWMVVGERKTEAPGILSFYESPHIDYRPLTGHWSMAKMKAEKWLRQQRGRQDYSHLFSGEVPRITGGEPEILHLHNLHGGYFDLRVLPRLTSRIPTFATLEDCWWFSGHCAYPLGCERWRNGCGRCPQLENPPEPKWRDATGWNWREKRAIFERSRVHVASPSQWLLDRAKKSILGPAISQSRVIPHGLDLEVFSPGDKAEARRRLHLPEEARIGLFSANAGKSSPFKDLETIRRSAKEIGETGGDWLFLAVGEEGEEEVFGKTRIRYLPYLEEAEGMAEFYRAADVYLHAAKNEAFGIVIAEAMACGLPVVATAVDGIPEVVDGGRAGHLVPAGDAGAMAEAVRTLAKDGRKAKELGEIAQDHARRNYDVKMMLDRYESWYLEVLPDSRFGGPSAGGNRGDFGREGANDVL